MHNAAARQRKNLIVETPNFLKLLSFIPGTERPGNPNTRNNRSHQFYKALVRQIKTFNDTAPLLAHTARCFVGYAILRLHVVPQPSPPSSSPSLDGVNGGACARFPKNVRFMKPAGFGGLFSFP
jgi:hypothetical protein